MVLVGTIELPRGVKSYANKGPDLGRGRQPSDRGDLRTTTSDLSFLSAAWLSAMPIFPNRQLRSLTSNGKGFAITDLSHAHLHSTPSPYFSFRPNPTPFLPWPAIAALP